jgi:hypothetical protein
MQSSPVSLHFPPPLRCKYSPQRRSQTSEGVLGSGGIMSGNPTVFSLFILYLSHFYALRVFQNTVITKIFGPRRKGITKDKK